MYLALYAIIPALFDYNFDPFIVLANVRQQLYADIGWFDGNPAVIFQRIDRIASANNNQRWHVRAIGSIYSNAQ